jgi:oligosaccharide 4-alpha-D-glucosyltransferase
MQKLFTAINIALFVMVSTVSFSQNKDSWKVENYAANIVKITHIPQEYNKSYNVTNAVIAKPLANVKPIYSFTNEGSIILNNNAISLTPSVNNDGYNGFKITLQKDEMIFGGGERALPLNRRGKKFDLYNNPWYAYGVGADNLNYSVPFFISNKGYGIFFDNGSKGYADIGKTDSLKFEVGFVSGEINAYIITGKSYQEILSSYHKLTGTQPLPPRWCMGNLMSRFGYTSQQQVTEIAGKMKAEKIPVDAIIFDLFWFGDSIKGFVGNLDWVNKEKWQDPVAMMSNFKKQNINTVLITEPFVLEHTNAYEASLNYWSKDIRNDPYTLQNFYFGKGGLIDIFRKDAGDWIWNYHYKKQIKNGVMAWWTDLGEPEAHEKDMYHNLKDIGLNRMASAYEVHNIYGHYWNKMMFENYAKDYPTQRLFHLNRSGFAGSQRYSIFPWSGDVERSWKGLQAQPLVMLGMSMSGVPYIHADAGGFALGQDDGELFVRWLQFATYTPIFRPHGTALYSVDPPAPSFPSEAALFDEPYKTLAKNAIIERYKMLPYNYTLAYRQAKFAEPLVKPLLFNYATDSNAVAINDEYLFGDNVLFAPVLQQNQTNKKVYLPQGFWYNVATNNMVKGGEFVEFDVTDYKKTLFYKEGSFIPQYNCNGENTTEINRKNITVFYIPSTTKSYYEMYDDDGETKNALTSNQFELIKFSCTPNATKAFTINISSNNGKYKNKPTQRNISLTIPTLETAPKQVLINGVATKNLVFENGIATINVVLKAVPVKVEVKL